MENLMKFTIQLAMLSSLFDEKMISEKNSSRSKLSWRENTK